MHEQVAEPRRRGCHHATQGDVNVPVRALKGRPRRFWRTIPDGLGFDELLKKYPRGSDEFEYISKVMIFRETMGSLLKHGLLNEDLAFDTFLDAPPWPKVERFFKERRQKERSSLEGENIEYAFRHSLKWKKTKERRARWLHR